MSPRHADPLPPTVLPSRITPALRHEIAAADRRDGFDGLNAAGARGAGWTRWDEEASGEEEEGEDEKCEGGALGSGYPDPTRLPAP